MPRNRHWYQRRSRSYNDTRRAAGSRSLMLLFVFMVCSLSQPATQAVPRATAAASADDTTGGHLDGGPASPVIALRTAADAHVTPLGSYKTSIPLDIPPAPGAPTLSLTYDSAMGLGVAGVGWDLATGWPALISRDTRFGTPIWDYASPWMWGGAPLVPEDAATCTTSGVCTYRTAPDSLATIAITQITATAVATVTLSSGTELVYQAIHYDGIRNPRAPAQATTDVLGFQLARVRDPNGYVTCFINHPWGDTETGRAAVLEQILYGPGLPTTCVPPPGSKAIHRIVFETVDPTRPPNAPTTTSAPFYYAPISYRFGAPVAFNNLLREIQIYPADWPHPEPYVRYRLTYEDPTAPGDETRQPRLASVSEQSWWTDGTKPLERVLREFTYGRRQPAFDPSPHVLALGRYDHDLPSSLSGSETRPVRLPQLINNPNGIFQTGADQNEEDAPPGSALTKYWTTIDINGDGLLDTLVADEQGPAQLPSGRAWPTYEESSTPGPRPAQQVAFVNNGIARGTQFSTRVILDTTAAGLSAAYPQSATSPTDPLRRTTNWIWQDGRGQTRTGMPQSVTSPEVYEGGTCPAIDPAIDTRLWPYLPDHARLGAARSFEAVLGEKLGYGAADIDVARRLLKQFRSGFVPRSTVSAQLSGWTDLNHDGVVDWVVTPAMIERFTLRPECTNLLNPPIPRDPGEVLFPHPRAGANEPQFSATPWYMAPGTLDALSSPGTTRLAALPTDGPPGPIGQPLSFSVDWSQGDTFGYTIPIGSSIASLPQLAQGPKSPAFWMAMANLTVQSVSPRTLAGTSFNLDVSTGSATQSFANSAISSHARSGEWNFGGAITSAAMSSIQLNLDVTLLSGGNVGRSQNRSELMDWNADGCPDYLLYDSVGHAAGSPPTRVAGGLLLYRGDCTGRFLPPVRINDGYDTQQDQVALAVRQAAAQVGAPITIDPVEAAAIGLPVPLREPVFPVGRARIVCDDITLTPFVRCGPLLRMGQAAYVHAINVITAATPVLTNSPDALPAERDLLVHAAGVAGFLKTALDTSAFDPALSPARIAASIVEARRLSDQLAGTATLLGWRSRINVPSKGESRTARFQACVPGVFCNPGKSIVVQTAGLVDLNGDGLPDYVNTTDVAAPCVAGQWEVYWGTGTSNLAAGRGFVAESDKACITVPRSPTAVRTVFPDASPVGVQSGYATLPMMVTFTRHDGDGLPGTATQLTTYTFVSLVDYNQDGRPDLVLAQETGEWNPTAKPLNSWRVYLNAGRGFDLDRPMLVSGLSVSNGTLPPGVIGARDAQYPGIASGASEVPIVGGKRRSNSSVDVGFLDVDADGTADLAQRVRYRPQPQSTGPDEAAILYWSRAGTGPQDLLIGELEPLTGAQTLVTYRPAPSFQWPNATSDGQAPAGGHRLALGTTAFLVSSVTVRPLAGRPTRATAIGYDYKDPYFDLADRVFRGYGRIAVTPLDPVTGTTIANAASLVIFQSYQPHGGGGETLERVIDGGGAPIAETLHSYTETVSLRSSATTVGITQATFTARTGSLSVEYPTTLQHRAILDLGFDARMPLINRADRAVLPLVVSPTLSLVQFDPAAATGGGLRFDATRPQQIDITSTRPTRALPQFTLETWFIRTARPGKHVLLQQPDGYELVVDGSGQMSFAVKLDGVWTRLSGGNVAPEAWTHVAASFDGSRLRLFINGTPVTSLATTGSLAYPSPMPGLRIGSGRDLSTGKAVDPFDGVLGELRIYPEAWITAPRVTERRTAYQLSNPRAPDFGMPVETWSLGDLADPNDDVYEKTTYATPQRASMVRGAVATRERRIFIGPAANDLGGYLDYSELSYDGLTTGQVITGNLTVQAVYTGTLDVAMKPTRRQLVETTTRYASRGCAGVPTEVEDPAKAVTRTGYDATCTFALTLTNALSQTTTNQYYGVDAVGYTTNTDAPAGRYGQLKTTTDANGGRTYHEYDVWGRPTLTSNPYDLPNRPGIRIAYTEPVIGEDDVLSTPTRVHTLRWDDIQHDYITTYTFGDGQTQVEAVRDGQPDWTISGTQDFDALGRVIVTYRPRFLSEARTARGTRCPSAGVWCDPPLVNGLPREEQLTYDPLRDPLGVGSVHGVAHLQTAYDRYGRVVRTYGPDVPACIDPSVIDVFGSGNLVCDDLAQNARPVGHFTRYEYPEVGVIRVVDARGVPTVSSYDALGRLRRTEEYVRGRTQAYASATYTYDHAGNLTGITDSAGNRASATYDARGHRLTSSDPDLGRWTYSYDARGLMDTQIDARGALTDFSYDALGRVVTERYFQPVAPVGAAAYTFDGGPDDSDVADPIKTSPTRQWDRPLIPGTTNRALHFRAGASDGQASFGVDMTQAVEAELSFRHLWYSTRCRIPPTPCPIDDISVEYRLDDIPITYVLLTKDDLAPKVPGPILGDPASVPVTRVRFPSTVRGKRVTVIFRYNSVNAPAPGFLSGWGIDDIRVDVKIRPLEDVVEHHYDSAEVPPGYQGQRPVVDVTFDVPERVMDRSPVQNKITFTQSISTTAGISGKAALFDGASALEVNSPKLPPFDTSFTVETWVNPSRVRAGQNLVWRDSTFALERDAQDYLRCGISVLDDTASSPLRRWVYARSTVRVPEETWTHVAMTYRDGMLRCYVNGRNSDDVSQGDVLVLEGSLRYAPLDTSASAAVLPGPIFVGKAATGALFKGAIDEVRVYATALQPAELLVEALSPLQHGPPRGNVLDLSFSDPKQPEADSSLTNNHAVPIQPQTLQPGIAGTAVNFGGSPINAIVVRDTPSLQSDELTAEVWVKTLEQGDRLLLGKWHGTGAPGWRLALNKNSGRVRFEVVTVTPGPTRITTTDFVTEETINNGEWRHVAATYDGKTIRVYIDGKPAHRVCTNERGDVVRCAVDPTPPCQIINEYYKAEGLPGRDYSINVCASGTVTNGFDVYAGAYEDPNTQRAVAPALGGMEDEIRISNYAKRDFEVAASAREYRDYTQVLGRAVALSNRTAADITSFDLLGHPVTVQRWTALTDTYEPIQRRRYRDRPYVVRTAFDRQGRDGSMRYPNGEVVVSQYDRGGTRVALTGYGNFDGATNAYGKQPYVTDVAMTATGRMAGITYGNAVMTRFRYDEGPTQTSQPNVHGAFGNELLAEQTTVLPSGIVLQDQHYVYDEVGNLRGRRDYGPLAWRTPPVLHTNPISTTYHYDDVNRLTEATVQFGALITSTRVFTYTYDQLGNLTEKEGAALLYGSQVEPSACGTDQKSRPPHAVTWHTDGNAVTEYCYDANGALAEKRGSAGTLAAYQHTVSGRLSTLINSAATYRFTYDGTGARVYKVEERAGPSGAKRVTIEPFPFYRIVDGAVETSYFAAGRRVVRRTGPHADDVSWYHSDHLGSTNSMTGIRGEERQDAYSEYTPFGSPLPTAPNNDGLPPPQGYGQTNTPDVGIDRSGGFQFTGKELDETGLYNYGARYYDPTIGRFIEPDRRVSDVHPQALNRYSYVLNNPLKFIDPTGWAPQWVGLTSQRLWQQAYHEGVISSLSSSGTNRDRIGNTFEAFALRGLGVPKFDEKALPSFERDIMTGGMSKEFLPDAALPMTFRAELPIPMTFMMQEQTLVLPYSAFIEVKALSPGSRLTLSYDDYQLSAYIDFLSTYSPAAKIRTATGLPVIPKIVFVTTADVKVGQSYLKAATQRGVAVWQRIAEENLDAEAGEKRLRLGEPKLLNPEVYVRNPLAPQVSPGDFLEGSQVSPTAPDKLVPDGTDNSAK